MSETINRIAASIFFYLNLAMASLSVISYLIGWLSNSFIFLPHIVNTVAYAALVLYWRFWYVLALPSFYLGQVTYAPRRKQLITAVTVLAILLIKFLYGYQLPD